MFHSVPCSTREMRTILSTFRNYWQAALHVALPAEQGGGTVLERFHLLLALQHKLGRQLADLVDDGGVADALVRKDLRELRSPQPLSFSPRLASGRA